MYSDSVFIPPQYFKFFTCPNKVSLLFGFNSKVVPTCIIHILRATSSSCKKDWIVTLYVTGTVQSPSLAMGSSRDNY